MTCSCTGTEVDERVDRGGGVCCGRAVVKYYNCVSGLVYYIYYCSILVNG